MIIDHEGEDDIGGATIDELACVLLELETPASVTTQMDSTRALDGRQSASWDTYYRHLVVPSGYRGGRHHHRGLTMIRNLA